MILLFTCTVLLAFSFVLLLEKAIIRKVFGLVLLGSTINLVIFISGRFTSVAPAFIGHSKNPVANPLPQALILTAIVIGFGLLAYLCVLLRKIYQAKTVAKK
jgi:multicomponent Na+:H+ antiporter subunit C